MALKLNERYPGRANNPNADYPQGSFKNRTAPGAQDGTYLEQDWTNDQLGFFSSLLSSAGVVASGLVDKVGASQYFDSLMSIISGGSSRLLADNGYVVLPSWLGGIIIQWGRAASAPSTTFYFPIAFPNSAYAAVTCGTVAGGSVAISGISISSNSTFTLTTRFASGEFTTEVCNYIAIGR